MLERLARTKAVLLKPEHEPHRKLIEKSIERNHPLIDLLVREASQDDGRLFVVRFKLRASGIVIPEPLDSSLLRFADEVSLGWLTKADDGRVQAVRVPAFTWNQSDAHRFFGYGLQEVVLKARPLATILRENESRNPPADRQALNTHLLEIARRLTVGFSPQL